MSKKEVKEGRRVLGMPAWLHFELTKEQKASSFSSLTPYITHILKNRGKLAATKVSGKSTYDKSAGDAEVGFTFRAYRSMLDDLDSEVKKSQHSTWKAYVLDILMSRHGSREKTIEAMIEDEVRKRTKGLEARLKLLESKLC